MIKNKKGQAIFEFIFFLPFMIMLIFLMMTIGNSVNTSINQQKITRSYFYARIKNNSMMPLREDINDITWRESLGMFFIGWMEKQNSASEPIQPCHEFKIPLENEETECGNYQETSTSFVRVGTVYGACGATYVRSNQGGTQIIMRAPGPGSERVVASEEGCLIR